MDLNYGPLGVTRMSTVEEVLYQRPSYSLRMGGRVWIQDCLSIGLCLFHKATWLSLGFGDGVDNSIQCHWEILGNSPIVGLCPM